MVECRRGGLGVHRRKDRETWSEVDRRHRGRVTLSVAVDCWDAWVEVGGRKERGKHGRRPERKDVEGRVHAYLVRLGEEVRSSCQVVDGVSQTVRRGKCEGQHLVESDRDGCKGPEESLAGGTV